MDLHLNGKTALVTGASRGIGLAAVQTLAAEGVRVVGTARTITPELKRSAIGVIAADLSATGSARRLVAEAEDQVGPLDYLVNNAGGVDKPELAGFEGTDDDYWQRMFSLNFFAAVATTRAAIPSLARNGGAVVNISSIGAWHPGNPTLAYDTAKAALKAFGEGLATELGPKGIRVNTISPGPVRTAIWEAPDGVGAQLAAASNTAHDALLADVPRSLGLATGRMIEPTEVAALIAYLLSPVAASITGADYLIDGGAIRTP
ncbi:SDR family oxidoreductase [Gordonia sp. CPCC 205333]|uniref:SDR family oxidoreductase n=1 Tax=Gordonia sp. CPCC 205333 TaxID=3140790 RepID=UPI003AF3EFCC